VKLPADESQGIPEISRSQKKAAYVFMGLLCVYVILRGIVGARSRLFWFDELFTLTIASQPNLHDMWTAIWSGFDSAPPLFYLVERAALGITSNTEIALRLPSIFAFPCTLICLFVYAKKRNGEALACLCALLVLATNLFHSYLTEARAYSMVIACVTFAMVCYQRAASRTWTILLGLALLVAGSLHYYAIFAMIPFWVAEGVALLTTKKFRWPVWAALLLGVLPLVVFWPLLMTIKSYYGPHMFAKPSLSAVRGYYATFFLMRDTALGLAVAVVAVAAVVWRCLWKPGGDCRQANGENSSFDWGEGALLLSFVGLPFVVFAATVVTHGILLNRYAIAATIGLSLGIITAIWVAGRRTAVLFALLLFFVVGVREFSFWFHRDFDPFAPYFSARSASELQRMKAFVQNAGRPDLPVVVSDCLLYSQFIYYSEPNWKSRVVYLVDAPRELRYSNSDSSSRTLTAFGRFFPLRVADYSEFTIAHTEFLLYSEGLEWYVAPFLADGFSLELLASDPGQAYGQVYLVRTKQTPGD
jgi:hypothetical protein